MVKPSSNAMAGKSGKSTKKRLKMSFNNDKRTRKRFQLYIWTKSNPKL
jgi:hypothetical protein